MVGIYKITSPSGKIYIGQSKNIEERFKSYKIYNCRKQPHLYNSLRKYGSKNHVYEIVHELPIDVKEVILDNYEILYMDLYNSIGAEMLNMIPGGQLKGRGKGVKMSDKNKELLRNRMLGNKYSLGTKNALGTRRTEEHKEVRRNLWKKGIYKCNCIPIKCNETGKKFDSIKDCVSDMNFTSKYAKLIISLILRGKRKNKVLEGYTFSKIL